MSHFNWFLENNHYDLIESAMQLPTKFTSLDMLITSIEKNSMNSLLRAMILDMLITVTCIRERTEMMLPLLIQLMMEFRNFLLQSSHISFGKSNLLKLSPRLYIKLSNKNEEC